MGDTLRAAGLKGTNTVFLSRLEELMLWHEDPAKAPEQIHDELNNSGSLIHSFGAQLDILCKSRDANAKQSDDQRAAMQKKDAEDKEGGSVIHEAAMDRSYRPTKQKEAAPQTAADTVVAKNIITATPAVQPDPSTTHQLSGTDKENTQPIITSAPPAVNPSSVNHGNGTTFDITDLSLPLATTDPSSPLATTDPSSPLAITNSSVPSTPLLPSCSSPSPDPTAQIAGSSTGPDQRWKKRKTEKEKEKMGDSGHRKTKRVKLEIKEEPSGWADIKQLLRDDQNECRERHQIFLGELQKQSALYEKQLEDDREFKNNFLAALLSLKK
ncbi:hypothetical protein V5O48_018162 [Marasmius crinis-equi]|uniref:Uncharacterized protein n=1 Tax=Marasmius crinis-equi TaxID=585013 RepID=A0ABR3ELY9_9AGAR